MQFYPELSPFCLVRSRTYVFYGVCMQYLLLTGCRALFTFNQYFVTFGPPAKREATITAMVSNSLFCVYVYAKYNQTNRARGTVFPPFPLLTILPTVRRRTGAGGQEEQRCSSGSKSKSSENYLQSICKPHIHIQMCVCANRWKLRRSWRQKRVDNWQGLHYWNWNCVNLLETHTRTRIK